MVNQADQLPPLTPAEESARAQNPVGLGLS